MKVYSKYSMRDRYSAYPEHKLEKLKKNIGNVYAIKTKKGFALAQISDIERLNGVYICRVFKKIHENIPKNVEEIIKKQEDYIIQCMISSLVHFKRKQAVKLEKLDVPSSYKTPDYTKFCMAFGGNDKKVPMKYWHIVPDYLPLGELIDKKDWVNLYLGKDLYDISWKEDFKKLNPSGIIDGDILINWLENNWSLDCWLPSDFNKPLDYIWKEEQSE